MAYTFELEIEVPDRKTEPCKVSISGDVHLEGWPRELMRGVVEMITLIDQMYGYEIVDEALKARVKE